MAHQATHRREAQQRLLLAQAAARIMAEHGTRDFSLAKRKAAEQLGIPHGRHLPGNDEIEAALREYQQLFQHNRQPQQLETLRQTALQAMRLLAPFSPRLVGAVLNGSADLHSPISLHLFADTSEEVTIYLMEHQIPFDQGERRLHYAGGREETRPLLRFYAGESALELTLFSPHGLRQPPLSPVDGNTMHRANLSELQQLLDGSA